MTKKVIKSSRMRGTDPLSVEDLRYLTVDSFDQAARNLIDNYNNEPTLMVGLTFSQDNTKVDTATPILAGRVDRMKFDANKYWSFTRRLEIVIKKLDLKLFTFSNTLTSGYLDHSKIEYSFEPVDDNEPVEKDWLSEEGFQGFVIKVYTHPISSTTVKMQMALFPLELDILKTEHTLSMYDNFPAFEIRKQEIGLGPQRTDELVNNYGLPILPVVKLTAPLSDNGPVPSRLDIVRSINAMLCATSAPEIRKSKATLYQRWGELKVHGESKLVRKEFGYTWPPPPEVETPTGKILVIKPKIYVSPHVYFTL